MRNPILPGFNPDPSIVRRGGDYYIATSTFEWFPAVQLHHSTDLHTWTLIGHAIEDDRVNLRGVPASGGVWAPALSVEPDTGRFYLAFSVVKSQVAEVFDVDNYVMWADEIDGPWSQPLYLNSLGFDPSIFHDDDGSKWLVVLEWETRPGHEHPGWIVAQRFDPARGAVGDPVRIHHGTTDRGAMEGPHLYKRDGVYYLMTAEGGTGFGHGVCLARSESPLGPFEPDPGSPFITSQPRAYNARGHRDFLRPEHYNPATAVQKAGHGTLVEGPEGEWFVAHLSSRPLPGTLSSILGRETSLQRVEWTEDGWLRLAYGGVLAQETFDVPARPHPAVPETTDLGIATEFDGRLSPHFAAPRGPVSESWCQTGSSGLVLRGRDSLHSVFDLSLVATRRRDFVGTAETLMTFAPRHFSQSAGLTVYYDVRNFAYLRQSWSEVSGSPTIALVVARGGQPEDEVVDEVPAQPGSLCLRVVFDGELLQFAWRPEAEEAWRPIGGMLDGAFMADEPIRGFTGQFVGVAAVDGLARQATARFDRFSIGYRSSIREQRLSEISRLGIGRQ